MRAILPAYYVICKFEEHIAQVKNTFASILARSNRINFVDHQRHLLYTDWSKGLNLFSTKKMHNTDTTCLAPVLAVRGKGNITGSIE